jgi:hypothetical protein
MQGGASPGAPRGEGNGMWKHGLRSIGVIERRRSATAEMGKMRRENAGVGARLAMRQHHPHPAGGLAG